MKFSKCSRIALKVVSVVAAAALHSISSSAYAATDCVALARVIATEYKTTSSQRELNAIDYYTTCHLQNDTGAGGITVGYDGFSVGFTQSHANSATFCQQSFAQLGLTENEFAHAKTVVLGALDTNQ